MSDDRDFFPKNYRIAITGSTGMVGSYLIRGLLDRGYTHIRAMKRKSSALHLLEGREDELEWVEGNLLDTEKLYEFTRDVDVVFHCGASVTFNPAARQKIYNVNVQGTADLVDACLENGVKRFIFCSSISALGRENLKGQVTENTDWKDSRSLSDYGRSKYYGEMEVWRAHAEGLSASIISPSLIFGGGLWQKGTGRLFQQVDNGLPFYPSGMSGFVDVRDVVEMMIMMVDEKHDGQRYICNAENKTYREVLNRIAENLQKPAPSVELKKWMVHFVPVALKFMRIFGLKLPKVTKPMLMASTEKVEFDNSKFIRATGFSYRPIDPLIDELCELYLSSKEEKRTYVLLPL